MQSLILSDCKSALTTIERAYRQQAQRAGDNRKLISAILLKIKNLQRTGGYVIFLWTPGHAGISSNAMADAAAKAHLDRQHSPNTSAAFLNDIGEDIIVTTDVRTGDIRDRWLYREAKRMGYHGIIHRTFPRRSIKTNQPTNETRDQNTTKHKDTQPWTRVLAGTTASNTAYTDRRNNTTGTNTPTEDTPGNATADNESHSH